MIESTAMNRFSTWVGLIALAVLLAWAPISARAIEIPAFETQLGEPMPAFRGLTDAGKAWTWESAQESITLVHVFSCTSEICGDSLVSIEEFIYLPLEKRGIKVIGIARDATPDQVVAFREQQQLKIPILPDPDRKLSEAFAEKGRGVPRTIITDTQGIVRYQHEGYRSGREAEFRAVIEALLAGKEVPVTGGALQGAATSSKESDMMGKPLPPMQVETWITDPPKDPEGKFVLYEFWATWCGPCRLVMPHLQEMHDKYGDTLAIYSVSSETEDRARRYIEKNGFTYPLGVDPERRTANELQIYGIPHAYLTNPDGVVIWQGSPLEFKFKEGLLEYLLKTGKPISSESSFSTSGE